MGEETELELVETKKLIAELLRRTDAGVCMFRQCAKLGEARCCMDWHGDRHVLLGLLAHCQHALLAELDARNLAEGQETR